MNSYFRDKNTDLFAVEELKVPSRMIAVVNFRCTRSTLMGGDGGKCYLFSLDLSCLN